jgi:hypothetical protein
VSNDYLGMGKKPKHRTPEEKAHNAALCRARERGHQTFDGLWRGTGSFMQRGEAYAWLAGQLGLTIEDCHFSKFSMEQCQRAVNLVRAHKVQQKQARRNARP